MNKIVILWLICCCRISLCYASEHEHQLVKPKKIGIFSAQNKREYREDRFYHGIVENGNFYAVYDGHGVCDGHIIAEFLANNFHNFFKNSMGTMQERMIAAFKNVDQDKFVKQQKQAGSTAAVVYIKDNKIHCAHAGDSRVLLINDNGEVCFHTNDHKPNRADEYFRIVNSKGLVFNKRVNGFLAISRAIGDYGLDKRLIIAEPEYKEIPLTKKHTFLVLATDGLWDIMTNEEVATILHEHAPNIQDMNLFAKMLALFAIKRGSQDNITVMLVDLLS